MQYSKKDVFDNLKQVILNLHPDIDPEVITHKASFWWTLNLDHYDLIEIIMHMEQRYKLLNNNISYMKQFSYLDEFCDNFYNILKANFPENAAKEPLQVVDVVKAWLNPVRKLAR